MESNENPSVCDNSPSHCGRIYRVRIYDSHSLLGTRLRLVAFENRASEGTASTMAADTCDCRPRSSQRPGHSLPPTMDANWSRPHTVWEMGKLGRPCFYCSRALRPSRKGVIS